MTGIEKLLNILESKDEVSTAEIRRRTGLSDPSTAVRDLRNSGYNVRTNQYVLKNGKRKFTYELAA